MKSTVVGKSQYSISLPKQAHLPESIIPLWSRSFVLFAKGLTFLWTSPGGGVGRFFPNEKGHQLECTAHKPALRCNKISDAQAELAESKLSHSGPGVVSLVVKDTLPR